MKYFFILILILISDVTYGQNILLISGTVSDQSKQTIPFASIGVYKDSVLVKGTISNENGKYLLNIKPGVYLFKVTVIGYQLYADSVHLGKTDLTLNITLKDEANTLNQVNISSQRPLIERKVDRLIFNVENSIFNKGFNAIDVLTQTPRVDVSSENEIKLIGKSNLAVMIDGRIVQGDELKQRLSAIRSDNIAKVEVITTPPAKYSAEGNSGLINIILKKNPLNGWLFNVTSGFRQRKYSAADQAFNVNYKTNKIDLNFSTSAFIDHKKYDTKRIYNSPDILWESDNTRNSKSKNLSFNSSLNYKLDKKTNIGLITDLTFENGNELGKTNTSFRRSQNSLAIDSGILSVSPAKSRYQFYSVSPYYDYLIDSTGKKLLISGNYFLKNTFNNRNVNSNISSNNSRIEDLVNNADVQYKGSSVNVDLELPFHFVKIETGAAVNFVNNLSNTDSSDDFGNNRFLYKERTYAAYISGNKDFNKKWSGKIGLRYEHTKLNSILPETEENNKNVISQFFPTGYLSYKTNENMTLSLAYSRRIEKPMFYYLNPYRVYIDNYSYSTGNPNLLPSFSNNIELSQTYKNNFTATLSASAISNGIGYVTRFSPNSIATISLPENYFKQKTLGLDLSYTLPLKWVNSYNSFNINYSVSNSYKNIVDLPDLDGLGAYYSIRNSFPVNSKKSTFLILNYFQRFSSREAFYKYSARSNIDLGARFQTSNGKLQYNVFVSDVFKKNITVAERKYMSINETLRTYNDMRYFNVSVSYSFGNTKVELNNKDVNTPDKNRTIL